MNGLLAILIELDCNIRLGKNVSGQLVSELVGKIHIAPKTVYNRRYLDNFSLVLLHKQYIIDCLWSNIVVVGQG